ncbi:MAG: TIGR00303 family protein [Leptolyngbyaceae cyanobacterium CRU_2_3]|nr:TIGR00303 family protein [Leptolyngbyaceae cyanobacterium CRU_2_3]
MIRAYSQVERAKAWMRRFRGTAPAFACVLGFTETGLIPGISAAGATPHDRQYTAVADAEFLLLGVHADTQYPLPPLKAGASPVLITRAIVSAQNIPIYLFNAGLPHSPSVPAIDLQGMPARCLSRGNALDLAIVQHLLQQGLMWGEKLAAETLQGYLVIGECVVGGTTTALALLTGLGWQVSGKVNSSHPTCNHQQKWQVVQAGLTQAKRWQVSSEQDEQADQRIGENSSTALLISDPLQLVAAVGDPMQIVVAGMAIAASRSCGVLLAGGTQMLAVYALMRKMAQTENLSWQPDQILVGTTRWVAEDPTGDTGGLAELLDIPLLATQLSFAESRYEQLRAYEQGFVKEGVGAGGCAIAAHLYQDWHQAQLLEAIETLTEKHEHQSVESQKL